MRYLWGVTVAAVLGLSGCATGGGAAGGGAAGAVVAGDIYQLPALKAAFEARGFASKIEGDSVVTRFEDLGVVLLTQPNAEREFIRMYAIWGREPNTRPDCSWLERVNETNKSGIVKLYLDEDFDLVAEWYTEVVPGLTTDGVVRTGEAFSMRARDAARGLSGMLTSGASQEQAH